MAEINRKGLTILLADDDADDRLMAKEALMASHLNYDLRFVEDGEELMDYLKRKGKYSNSEQAPPPAIILLDLNMPRKDGREALKEIKSNPALRHIPILVLTTSCEEADINTTYETGVNSYIVKPSSFSSLVNIMKSLGRYWLQTVELPDAEEGQWAQQQLAG